MKIRIILQKSNPIELHIVNDLKLAAISFDYYSKKNFVAILFAQKLIKSAFKEIF